MKRYKLKNIVNRIVNTVYQKETLMFGSLALDKSFQVQPQMEVVYRFLGIDSADVLKSDDYLKKKRIVDLFERGGVCLGAFASDQLIGYIWAQFKPVWFPSFKYELDFGQDAYLGPDYVAPGFRGNRISGELRCKMMDYLRENGYHTAWGCVLESNKKSLNSARSIQEIAKTANPFKFQVTVTRICGIIVYKKVTERSSW